MQNKIIEYKVQISIGIVWLFHLSALIGMQLGYEDWFIQKTPLNLYISLLLFLVIYPVNSVMKVTAFVIFFSGGMFAEWLGVQYGLLFGTYEYGSNLGPKLGGVPYLIGTYWALLTFITAGISDYLKINSIIKIIIAAGLMVLLDFFMENSAPIFDFWTFEGGIAPLKNYSTWFIVAFIFQIVLRIFKLTGSLPFSLNLYLAQLLFFAFFYF